MTSSPVTISDRIRRLAVAALAGVIAAFVIASFAAKWWPEAWASVFWGSLIFWLSGTVNVALKEWRARDAGVFDDSHHWEKDRLPLEFRFISRSTTQEELVNRLGAYSTVGDSGALRYDLPSGGAVFILMNQPLTKDSHVSAVQYYEHENQVPVIPW